MLGTGISRSVYRDRNNDKRWDVSKINGLMGQKEPDKLTMMDGVGFSLSKNEDNFGFSFTDTISQNVMFDNSKRSLIMTDKYLEIGFVLPSKTLFGLGQHNSEFLLTEGDWTMFNRDQPGSPEAKGDGTGHLYGTHPFLMRNDTVNRKNSLTAIL